MVKKDCFGILENIFPVSKNGLREIKPECSKCPDRLLCLKQALGTREGIKMREEILDRASEGGLMNRIQRWSRKKELDRISVKQDRKRKRWWK